MSVVLEDYSILTYTYAPMPTLHSNFKYNEHTRTAVQLILSLEFPGIHSVYSVDLYTVQILKSSFVHST